MSSLDYDLCRSSWVGDYNDPNTFLDMFVTDGGNNRTGWSNARLRRAHRRTPARELDRGKRFEHFPRGGASSRSATTRRSARSITTSASSFTTRTRLGGIEANLLDEHPLKAMFWKK